MAGPMLISSAANNASIGRAGPSRRTRHSRNRTMPAQTPNATMAIAGCGPVSPKAKGSGGSSSAKTKNNEIHRRSEKMVHNAGGASKIGAASNAFQVSEGANATAAAHAPKAMGK